MTKQDQYIANLQIALITMKDAAMYVYNNENAMSDESYKVIEDAYKKCKKLLNV